MSPWLYQGDSAEILKGLSPDHIDALVTDPPAGIGFMGKDWDHDKGGMDEWSTWLAGIMRECYRVMKPGAYGLIWSLPRTSHWTALALERAGFEIRDCVTHLFGTGFPKSLDVGKAIDKAAGVEREILGRDPNQAGRKRNAGIVAGQARYDTEEAERVAYITAPATDAARQWSGWGTALKPAAEFWWLVRKPLAEKSVAANVLKHGTGGINIDGCRISTDETCTSGRHITPTTVGPSGYRDVNRQPFKQNNAGRFPANLVFSHSEGCVQVGTREVKRRLLDATAKATPSMFGSMGVSKSVGTTTKTVESWECEPGCAVAMLDERSIGASRFFYCAKASKSDRGEGNMHPTVKSTALMRYLCRLVTPPGGVILDPFMGSGSTGVAALGEGFQFAGIEQDAGYFEIASKRVNEMKPMAGMA